MLLERVRGTESEQHLRKLALQTLSLSASELKFELVGVIARLQREAKEQRKAYLEQKHPSQLTDEEKREILG
jgi:DNA primase